MGEKLLVGSYEETRSCCCRSQPPGSEEEYAPASEQEHRTAKRQEDRVCDRRDAMLLMGPETRCCCWGRRPARCATADGQSASEVALLLLGPAICCYWGGEEKLGEGSVVAGPSSYRSIAREDQTEEPG